MPAKNFLISSKSTTIKLITHTSLLLYYGHNLITYTMPLHRNFRYILIQIRKSERAIGVHDFPEVDNYTHDNIPSIAQFRF